MVARISVPGLTRRTKSEVVEKRDFLGINSPGFSFPMVNASGSALMMDRYLDSYSGSEIAYRAVQLKVNAMASLDLAIKTTVKDAQGNEDDEYDSQNPLCQLFNKKPNNLISAFAAKKIALEQLELTGQSFFWTPRNDVNQVPTALVNIFGKVTPLIDNTATTIERYLAPQLAGFQVETNQQVIYLLPHEVLWLRSPHPFVAWGAMPPWKAAMWAADLDRYAREWQAAEFKNGGKPTGVIYLGNMTEQQAQFAKAQFESQQTGTANAGKHLFLYGEAKAEYSRIGRTGVEMAYLESHAANAADMLHAFGVPVDLIIGQATYDNRHAAWVSLWSDTLVPALEANQADIDRQLLPDPSQSIVFDIRNVAALQENTDAIYTRTIEAADSDLVVLREARKMIGLEPFDDWRDELTLTQYRATFAPGRTPGVDSKNPEQTDAENDPTPPALPQADDTADEPAAEDAPAEDAAARSIELRRASPTKDGLDLAYDRHAPRVRRYVERLAEKQRKSVLNKVRKQAVRMAEGKEVRMTADDLFDEDYWTTQTDEGMQDAIDPIWTDSAAYSAALFGLGVLSDDAISSRVTNRARYTAESVTRTTKEAVEAALSDSQGSDGSISDLTASINGVFDDLKGFRAERIGITEATFGFWTASLLTAGQSDDIATKTWVCNASACPQCTPLDQRSVGINDTFDDGVDGPGLHPNCMCRLRYTTKNGIEIEGA